MLTKTSPKNWLRGRRAKVEKTAKDHDNQSCESFNV